MRAFSSPTLSRKVAASQIDGTMISSKPASMKAPPNGGDHVLIGDSFGALDNSRSS